MSDQSSRLDTEVTVEAAGVSLAGNLTLPGGARGVVVFAHGSGSGRFSPRNQEVAHYLNERGLGTLLFDLLTAGEHELDQFSREYRFNIDLLGERLVGAVDWLSRQPSAGELAQGLFGASTGAAAALIAAAERPALVAAVVSRGGRPDLAGRHLPKVEAPTLMIVGGEDEPVIGMNQDAAEQMRCPHEISIVPGATHLFEEPGKLDEVCRQATEWFLHYLRGPGAPTGG